MLKTQLFTCICVCKQIFSDIFLISTVYKKSFKNVINITSSVILHARYKIGKGGKICACKSFFHS